MRNSRTLLPVLLVIAVLVLGFSSPTRAATIVTESTLSGTVTDSLGRPLGSVSVELDSPGGTRVSATRSDASGAFSFTKIRRGSYRVIARASDFKPGTLSAFVAAHKTIYVRFVLESAKPLSLAVSARRLPLGQNGSINQVLLQAPGMIQDSTGQPLPRGMDDSVQYRINGVMIPNVQVLDLGKLSPRFAENIDVLTGSLPAQYGYRTGAVVDIHTRSGDIANGGSVEYFGGQRETMQPGAEYGGAQGSLSYFVSGNFLHSLRGVNPPTPGPDPLNDSANQGTSLAYLSAQIDASTSLNLIGASFVNDFGWPATPGQSQVYKFSGVPVYPSAKVSDR
jgi:hypothetical protein